MIYHHSQRVPPGRALSIVILVVSPFLTTRAAAQLAEAVKSDPGGDKTVADRQPVGSADAADQNSQLGLRLGGGSSLTAPVGPVGTGTSFDHLVSVAPGGRVEVGYRFSEVFLFGAYGEGNSNDALERAECAADETECTVAIVRVGVEARFYFAHDTAFQPWLGVGTGREWFSFKVAPKDEDILPTAIVLASGPEHARFSAGVDYRLHERWLGSAYVSYSTGRFTHVSYHGEVNGSHRGKQHEWILLGATVSFLP